MESPLGVLTSASEGIKKCCLFGLGFFAWLITLLPRSFATVSVEVLGKVLLCWAEETGTAATLLSFRVQSEVGVLDTSLPKSGLEESSPWEYPWLVSLSPEGLPSLPVAQSLLLPPLCLLVQDCATLACE